MTIFRRTRPNGGVECKGMTTWQRLIRL